MSEVFRTAASSTGDGGTRSILISFLAILIPLFFGWIQYLKNYILTNIFETILLLIWWMRLYETGKKAPWRVILRKTGSRWYNTLGSFRRIWLIRMLSGRVSRPPLIWQRPDIEAKAHFVMVVVYVHSWISSQCILYIFIPSTDWNYFPCIVYLIGFVKTLAIEISLS